MLPDATLRCWGVNSYGQLGDGTVEFGRMSVSEIEVVAGVDVEAVVAELSSKPAIAELATPERHSYEAYPLTMAALRAFRAADAFGKEVVNKLRLGSDAMLDLGNLYTAALPAWMAAGFEQALAEDSLEVGEEVLHVSLGRLAGRGRTGGA